MNRFVTEGLHAVIGLAVTGYLIVAVFFFYTGTLSLGYIPPHLILLGTAVCFLYVVRFHPFTNRIARIVGSLGALFLFVGAVFYLGWTLQDALILEDVLQVFDHEIVDPSFDTFLPEWWLAPILVFGAFCVFFGAVTRWGDGPYPLPRGIITIPRSPPIFGAFSTFLGLWAVLFVGFDLQRVIIIAPIFEELLKFGLALLIGSTLFGRSFLARVGVAAVVGALFGLTEHAVSYATEPDGVYLFRTIFHGITTMLSVGLYTRFEQHNHEELLWYAPLLAIVFHFLHNTFVVVSGVIGVIVVGRTFLILPLVYSSIAIAIMIVLLMVSLIRVGWVVALLEPFRQTLSDLV